VTRSSIATTVVVMVLVLNITGTARAQGWSVDLSGGRLVYDPALIDAATSTMMGTLRYATRGDLWVYGTAAVPASDSGTFWTSAGMGGRLLVPASPDNRVTFGADVSGHGFLFNDRVVDQGGSGATVEAIPFARYAVGAGFVEGRGGWRGHTLSFGGLRDNRGVFEAGARAGYGSSVRVEGDARFVHASEGTFPFVGATVAYQASRVGVWGQTGKWLATNLDDPVWAFGSGLTLSARTSLWGTVRQEAADPLYWNSPRRTWSIGVTQRLGRVSAPLVPTAPAQDGTVIVRLRASDAPEGQVRIAGDFNNWQSVPMQREGTDWVVRLSVAPGVYHYTFNTANGEWFVPASAPGRRDDGFGGYVAVLVVN
jgi:hypothetical protein